MQRQRSGVRLPSEFRALARDVRAITTLLNDYLRETDVDISDTMAAMEYREEPTFADDQVINPVTHVQLQAHHNLVAAIDHLGGVAACIAAENITLARFTSAFIHTQPHAFSLFKPARTQYDPQTPGAVPLGIAYEDMTTWLTVVMLALNTAAERCGYYFGWDMAKWSNVMNATMSKWVDALRP
jgi:hypothetical protein